MPLNVIINSLGSKITRIHYIQKSQSFECTICILASLMYSQWVMFAKELSTIIPVIKELSTIIPVIKELSRGLQKLPVCSPKKKKSEKETKSLK